MPGFFYGVPSMFDSPGGEGHIRTVRVRSGPAHQSAGTGAGFASPIYFCCGAT